VLVNWWSPKAGPCLRLYPLLDKLCSAYEGRFLLVNINTDEEKRLAREQGVNSLPLLTLFKGGEPKESLHGYQPEMELRRFLDRYTPRASDLELAKAVRDYQQGHQDAAITRLVQAAMEDPANLRIPATLAKLLMREGRLDEARKLLAALPEEIKREGEIAILLAHLLFLRLASTAPDADSLQRRIGQNPDDLEARHQLAALLLIDDQYPAAMDQLLEIFRRDRSFRDGAGRHGLLAVFRILGDDHSLVKRYRQLMLES